MVVAVSTYWEQHQTATNNICHPGLINSRKSRGDISAYTLYNVGRRYWFVVTNRCVWMNLNSNVAHSVIRTGVFWVGQFNGVIEIHYRLAVVTWKPKICIYLQCYWKTFWKFSSSEAYQIDTSRRYELLKLKWFNGLSAEHKRKLQFKGGKL